MHRVKLPTPTRATDALIGGEEQTEKKNKKKKIGSEFSTQVSWIIWSPPTTSVDHMVSLFFYNAPAHMGIYIYITSKLLLTM